MEKLYSIEICKILSKILIILKIFKKCQKLLILVKFFRKINIFVKIVLNRDLSKSVKRVLENPNFVKAWIFSKFPKNFISI